MSKSLLIVGAGSFATEVEEIARLSGYDNISFLDDNPNSSRCNPVVGRLCDIGKLRSEYSSAIVAFGDNNMRLKYTKNLISCGYDIPVLIHPNAYVSPDAHVDKGCIIRTNAVVSRYVHLQMACIVNAMACIDHDCIIGEGTHILIGAVVRNKIKVPNGTRIPANAVFE